MQLRTALRKRSETGEICFMIFFVNCFPRELR